MENQNFTVAFLVDQTPHQAYDAINNVRGWWTGEIEGSTNKLNDEFTYSFPPYHYSKHKLVEMIPGKKIVWLVTDSSLNFVEDKTEWNGTSISFDIAEKDGKTEVRFTHHGLAPKNECYDACSHAWTGYITDSLYNLITVGQAEHQNQER